MNNQQLNLNISWNYKINFELPSENALFYFDKNKSLSKTYYKR